MSLLEFNTIDDFLQNAMILREEYNVLLCSFFNKEIEEDIIRNIKNHAYNINLPKNLEYKKDIIWEYLNNDIDYITMYFVLKRQQ